MSIFAAALAAWRRRKWARLTPGQQQIRRLVNQMSPKERAELERELNTDTESELLHRTQAAHETRQKAIADERERRAPEVQAAHAARMKALADELDSAAAPVKYSRKKPTP